ncbi:hypothetical protein [Variovorax sp. WDL1]|uniref:hypothetical protein n=1 Tax=Variovorax sp. WDL1 TaxID=207745 RepID=UPI001E28AD3A|nr:hypothetical protein [Variovorax sp. WDL1]
MSSSEVRSLTVSSALAALRQGTGRAEPRDQMLNADALRALRPVLEQRMAVHRSLFEPTWVKGDGVFESFLDEFPSLDPGADQLMNAGVRDDVIFFEVARHREGVGLRYSHMLRFPLRYLSDGGEATLRTEALARLSKQQQALEAKNAAFSDAETAVLTTLRQLAREDQAGA